VTGRPARADNVLGVLGGTFDPIHFGHLRSALEVMQALQLEELRLIPLHQPPHRSRPHSSAQQRLQMIESAIADQPGLIADDRELRRAGKSYTFDTLCSIREQVSSTQPVCLLIGSDAYAKFASWYRADDILQLAHLVVMRRPGDPPPPPHPSQPDRLLQRPAGETLFQPVTQLDISSSNIRKLLRQGRSARYLLPDPVLDIIIRQGLYR